MDLRHNLGRKGEDLSEKYLKENNYIIIERNFLCRKGEIDIIAIDKNIIPNELVFFEVKTRSNNKFGRPIDSVIEYKKKHLEKAIRYFLYIRNLEDNYIRVDIIEIYVFNNKYYLNHIKQVF